MTTKINNLLSQFANSPRYFTDFLNYPNTILNDPELSSHEKFTLQHLADTSRRLTMFTPKTLPDLAAQLKELQISATPIDQLAEFQDQFTDNYSDHYTDNYMNSDAHAGLAKWAENVILQSGLDPATMPDIFPAFTPPHVSSEPDSND